MPSILWLSPKSLKVGSTSTSSSWSKSCVRNDTCWLIICNIRTPSLHILFQREGAIWGQHAIAWLQYKSRKGEMGGGGGGCPKKNRTSWTCKRFALKIFQTIFAPTKLYLGKISWSRLFWRCDLLKSSDTINLLKPESWLPSQMVKLCWGFGQRKAAFCMLLEKVFQGFWALSHGNLMEGTFMLCIESMMKWQYAFMRQMGSLMANSLSAQKVNPSFLSAKHFNQNHLGYKQDIILHQRFARTIRLGSCLKSDACGVHAKFWGADHLDCYEI